MPESAPESALYTQLQRYERKTGACLLQKQSEVQDALCRLQLIVKKLRIYLHNTHAKTSLPHPQVARQTSLLNESFGNTQAA